MKQVVLAIMVVMTMAGAANATTNAWDYFWGTALPQTFDPANTGWNEFFGETLNPQNTGWDNFWFQCQDPTKTADDCLGVIAVGIGSIIAAPIVITATSFVVSVGIAASLPPLFTAVGTPFAFTASGTVVFAPV